MLTPVVSLGGSSGMLVPEPELLFFTLFHVLSTVFILDFSQFEILYFLYPPLIFNFRTEYSNQSFLNFKSWKLDLNYLHYLPCYSNYYYH
jgi:hypothetical protein